MFDALSTPANESALGWDETDELDYETMILDSLAAYEAYSRDSRELGSLLKTIDELAQLAASIEHNGISPELLHFANADNQLSSAISSIPSLESLAEDYSTEQSEAAVEGIVEQIRRLVVVAAKKIRELGGRIAESIAIRLRMISGLEKRIKRYSADVQGKSFDEALAESKKVSAFNFADQEAMLKAADSFNSMALDVLHMPLPESKENRDRYMSEVTAKIKQHFGGSSIISEYGDLLVPQSKQGTLHALGYTASSFDSLVKGLNLYISNVQSNGSRLEQAVMHFEDEADTRLKELVAVTDSSSHTGNVSITSVGGATTSTTGHTYTERYFVLMHAYEKIDNLIFQMDKNTWNHGVARSSAMLVSLSAVYR